MSNQPSNTLGGMISGLFGGFSGRTNDDGSRVGASPSRKLVGGALLAAGAAYLYKRYKNGNLNVPGIAPKQ
ncbi:hypothetical protein MUN81_12300 [Hymenobacter sp. 5317J-9]|uniref:hypothetical protein n=1 Tax=Hymenobacter sp. 5317J-9 TaxID=2932250 RepID=UPI001FD6EDD6|nr:hypothetical protein [Hymenobacter sp. 5317J-9]UOQ96041.1 hypothetical protein MUN81_12300 [Hymenobacter sp. 5317J-9]